VLKQIIRALWLLLLLSVLSGCSSPGDWLSGNYTQIGTINDDSAAFEGKMIRVKGMVTGSGKMPFTSTGFFTLVDEAGNELSVMTELATPAEGGLLWSYGRVENIAIVKGLGMGVHFKEQRRICQPEPGEGHYSQLLACWLAD